MVELSADRIVELFEEDVGARKRLAELLVGVPDVRLAIINAVLRDVATKSDIDKLNFRLNGLEDRLGRLEERIARLEGRINGLEDRISGLENRIDGLERRIDALEGRIGNLERHVARLDGQVGLLVKVFIAFNLPMLLALIGILLKMIFM